MHVGGQLIPAGEDVTMPSPEPVMEIRMLPILSTNHGAASTSYVLYDWGVNVQGFVAPIHPGLGPRQSRRALPSSGSAVRVSVSPTIPYTLHTDGSRQSTVESEETIRPGPTGDRMIL